RDEVDRCRRHCARARREVSGARSADAALHRPPRARAGARRLRRRPEEIERAEARGDPDGLVRAVQGRGMSRGGILRPGMRAYFIPFSAGLVLAVSAFLPWVIVSGQVMNGVPEVPALWIVGLGALAATLALLSLITRKNSRHPLLVIGLVA